MINIQNIDDNKFFKWYLVRYLIPADHHPAKITKAAEDFSKKLDFRDIKFPVDLETFTILKERIQLALVFLVMKMRKIIQSMHQKNATKKTMLIYY